MSEHEKLVLVGLINPGDEHDRKAEELLPCPTYKEIIVCHDPATGITIHAQTCPAWRRPAVAAALRAQAEAHKAEVEKYKEHAILWREFHLHDSQADAIERIVQLKAEHAAMALSLKIKTDLVAQLQAELAAAGEAHKAEVERLNNALLLCQGELELAFKKYDEARKG